MKLGTIAIALTSTVLLSTFAYAGDNTDVIRASFERGLRLEASLTDLPAARAGAKSLDAINKIKEPDQIRISFERMLLLEPKARETRSESDAIAGKAG